MKTVFQKGCAGRVLSLLVLALCLSGQSGLGQAPEYVVTILGPTGSNLTNSGAGGINASGEVVGAISGIGSVTWTGTTPTILGSVAGSTETDALAINGSGEVAGYAYTSQDYTTSEALEWTGTTPTILGSLGGGQAGASGINASGLAVGAATAAGGAIDALEWTGTTPTILGSLGGEWSDAYAVNDSGEAVGFSQAPFSERYAVEWTGTTPTILGGGPETGTATRALGINDAGEIVGELNDQAVEWTGTTPMVLGSFGGNDNQATAINDLGEVVGFSGTTSSGLYAGFLYTSGSFYNLNALLKPGSGLTISTPYGINDKGQIAADAEIGAYSVAVLLTPVPEPGEMGLLAAGCGGVLLWVGRKRADEERNGAHPNSHHLFVDQPSVAFVEC